MDGTSDQAYVGNLFDNTVSVIDTRTKRVITTIPSGPTSIGYQPSELAADPKHHQVYVVNYNSDTVSVIDTSTNTVSTVIPHDSAAGIGTKPSAVDVDPDLDRAFVTNLVDGTVSVIDTARNKVISVIPHDVAHGIGTFLLDIAIDTSLHRAYVVNNTEQTVSVIDTSTGAVTAIIPHDSGSGIGSEPRQIAIDSVTHRAFVTSPKDQTVAVIDTTTNTVIAVLPHDRANGIGDMPFAVGVDSVSHQVYVATAPQITVVNSATLAVTRIIRNSAPVDYGRNISGIAMDPKNHQAFVSGASSQTVAILDLDATAPLARRGGADRYEVSARNSAAEFDPGVAVAYIASGNGFADALSGSAAAGSRGAPVLLTTTDGIPTVIGAELARLKPKRIIILGGTNSVGDSVQRALSSYAPVVDRLGGADRYVVAAAVSRDNFAPGIPVAYLASGAVFPDALSGSAVAANNGAPVLLTTRDNIPQATLDELNRLKPGRLVLLGGINTINATVESELKSLAPTTRIGGADRFDVSANASSNTFTGGVNIAYVASGTVFPDALSGSPAAAANGAPVLLVTADAIPASVASELDRLNPAQIVVLGGTNTISDTVYQQLTAYLR